jgi:hypothetical protein
VTDLRYAHAVIVAFDYAQSDNEING